MQLRARLALLALLAGLAACSDAPPPTDAALREFYGQNLHWRTCVAEDAPADARCATLRVPRSYDDPRGAEWSIEVVRLPVLGPEPRLGVIVTNPGGPGIPGVADLLASADGYDALRARYDMVSFDPRGVGRSAPAIHCLTTAQAAAIRNQVSDPETPERRRLADDLAREHATACEDAVGDSLRFFGTRDVARDMDVLRAVLGEEKLDYLGYSYGTYLGAVYAELFPGRTDRMVLDSAMNPANDYERLRHDQAVALQASVERFAADCATRPGCPLAADVPAAVAQIAGLIRSLDERPFTGADGRVLSGSRALHLVESAMYFPESGWPDLRAVLAPALAGDLAPLLAAAWGPGMYVNPADSPYLAVMCHDLQIGRDPDVVPGLAAAWEAEAALTGANRAWSVLPCTVWPAASDVPPAPVEASGSGDILVIGVTGDPATPVGWARALAGTLAHGHLLEWNGDGHIAYGRGGPCVDAAVEGFLLDGILPAEGAVCPPVDADDVAHVASHGIPGVDAARARRF